MRIEVVHSPQIVRPGGECPLVIHVWNTVDESRRCRLHLLGLPPGWEANPVETFDVEGREGVEVTVTLRVPSLESVGDFPLAVQLEVDGKGIEAAAVAAVRVEPTPHVELRVEPRVATGGRGNFVVIARNDSRRGLALHVDGRELSGTCRVAVWPREIEVGPGEEERLDLRVVGNQPVVGPRVPRPIDITATDVSGERWRVRAELRQSPAIPRWLILTGVFVVLAALWLVIVVALVRYVVHDEPDPYDDAALVVDAALVDDATDLPGATGRAG
jgi:hypothetical protein